MKKLLALLLSILLVFTPCLSPAQTTTLWYNYQIVMRNATTTSTLPVRIIGTGAAFHNLTWNVSGTVATCSVQVDSSVDGITWNSADVIASQTCTSNGTILSASFVANYVRINLTALSGAGATFTANLSGYISSPAGGGGSPTGAAGGDLGSTYPNPTVVATHLSAPLPVTQGGLALATLTTNGIIYGNGTSAPGLITPPAVNGAYNVIYNVTASATVAPTAVLPGVGVNAQSTSYSLLYSDRASYIKEGGGSTTTLTLPQITGNGASNYPFVTQNLNSGNETITANAADKIDNSATGGSATVLPKWAAFVYQDSSSAPGNWWTLNIPSFTAFGGTCTSYVTWSTSTGIGCAATVAFWGAQSGNASVGVVTANQTSLWGITVPVLETTSAKVGYNSSVADNTATLYDIGLYSVVGTAGTLVCHLGATAGTTTFNAATTQKVLSWTSTCNVPPGQYVIGLTGATGAVAAMGGQSNTFNPWCNVHPTANNATAGGVLNASITLPAASMISCVTPSFTFSQ